MEIKPWSNKRKLLTTIILGIFIGLSSSFLGIGIYMINQRNQLNLDKKTILGILSEDADFQRAVIHAAKQKECINQNLGFSLRYEYPLHPVKTTGEEACLTFTSTHPNGKQISITLTKTNEPKDKIMLREAKYFQYAQTDIINHPNRHVSRISGVKNHTPTVIYVTESRNGCYLVTYSPTSPTINGKVENLALSLTD